MQITVLRKMGYEGTYIYVTQFRYTFQYMFAWHNEVFMNHVVIKPKWWKILLSVLRLAPLYSAEQLDSSEQAVMSHAMDTIDELKKQKKSKLKAKKEKAKDDTCMWQATYLGKNKIGHFHCITHNKQVPMEQGKRPQHD